MSDTVTSTSPAGPASGHPSPTSPRPERDTGLAHLASYRRCLSRIADAWPGYLARRAKRLDQALFDRPVEKVAENILEDLFTDVLGWDVADVNLQIGRADMELSSLGIKRLVLEVKRPGSLTWSRAGIDAALQQARGYATDQQVTTIAVSDGSMLYAADRVASGLRHRLLIPLDQRAPALDLWWVCPDGIYRTRTPEPFPVWPVRSAWPAATANPEPQVPLHPKYRLPASCFAYVGSPADPHTWKLPFLTAPGAPDVRRLPKAIQSILSNYRGERVSIPRDAVGDVLVRLARAAATLRKLPCQCHPAAGAYVDAHHAVQQLGRIADVGCCS